MTNRLKIMWKLAIEEATKLRKYATRNEKENLVGDISSYDNRRCIYGKMTGDCYSERAGELIMQCATRVYEIDALPMVLQKLNGAPYQTHRRNFAYHSPIEVLIAQQDCGDEAKRLLVPFIKGETKSIKIPDAQ